jgi:predicted O-linked N-acetylglucosamine transferase (SPINDLY family)
LSRILKDTPGSRLLLKAFEFYDEPLGPEVVARFQREGVVPSRIEVLQRRDTFEEHLNTYARIDVALDPVPYNGTTTTFEALAMGVPVVARRGDRHVARVSAAILTNLGLTQLIADDEDQYVRIAAALAQDPARRASLRTDLRARLEASALCDGPAYARRMTSALRGMWREWCSRPR